MIMQALFKIYVALMMANFTRQLRFKPVIDGTCGAATVIYIGETPYTN